MEFCFIYINAMQKYDCMPLGNLTIREHPDFCKRVHLKLQIKAFLRGSWLDKRATSVEIKTVIRDNTETVQKYYEKCGHPGATAEELDLTWQAALDNVADAVLDCFPIVFHTCWDDLLDAPSKTNSAPEGLCGSR